MLLLSDPTELQIERLAARDRRQRMVVFWSRAVVPPIASDHSPVMSVSGETEIATPSYEEAVSELHCSKLHEVIKCIITFGGGVHFRRDFRRWNPISLSFQMGQI